MARNKNTRDEDHRAKPRPGLQPGFDPNKQIPASNTEQVSDQRDERINELKQTNQNLKNTQGRNDGEDPVEENSLRPWRP